MLTEILLLAAGIALMFKGSDYFVEASVGIGERARLPRVVVGGTLVSIATTSPELVVSIVSGIQKAPGLAVGNALGSAAANLGFIFALAAIMRPFEISPGELRWRSIVILGLTALLFVMTIDLTLPRWRGLILLAVGLVYLFLDYRRGMARYAEHGEVLGSTVTAKYTTIGRIVFFFSLGAAMVIGGSVLLVDSGTAIAGALGVPNLIVGLTVVAFGTSLPELATAIAAVRKKVFDLAAGNLIGANALNLTIITGTAASISPLSLNRLTQIYTFPAILIIFGTFFLFVRSKHGLARWEGVAIMGMYLAFIAGVVFLEIA
jgi:cation:H+ antiporter